MGVKVLFCVNSFGKKAESELDQPQGYSTGGFGRATKPPSGAAAKANPKKASQTSGAQGWPQAGWVTRMSGDDKPDAKPKPWSCGAPSGLVAATDQRVAAAAQLETLTEPTAACGTPEFSWDQPWPLKRRDFENPASSWVALVVAFDGGNPEEISGLIRLAKSSQWSWKALDKAAGATVPATQAPGSSDSESHSSGDIILADYD